MTTVLVVDDEESFHVSVAPYLRKFRVLSAYNARQADAALRDHDVDVVLLDLELPDQPGLDVLARLTTERPDLRVIVVTAHSAIKNAVAAIKGGAFDFMPKSYESYQLVEEYILRALEHRRWTRERDEAAQRDAWVRDAFASLEQTASAPLRDLVELLGRVADTPLTVLIEGESGVGKEIVARYIHARSDRADRPFCAVNLATVPGSLLESHMFGHVKGAFTGANASHVGKFESADGGTIFLDEIGELCAGAQVKLLRVLQEREIERLGANEPTPLDVRVLAATNTCLERAVAEGRFREDLFYRLNVVRVTVPPLRDRARDLPALVRALAVKHAVAMQRRLPTFSDDALRVLGNHDWPGNIRELENLVMRLVALHSGRLVTSDDIPPEYCLASLTRRATDAALAGAASSATAKSKENRLYFLARDQFERYLAALMVRRSGGNKKAAAEALGVSYTTIKEKTRDPED
jgi:DNA-binding NtrC family response regulator